MSKSKKVDRGADLQSEFPDSEVELGKKRKSGREKDRGTPTSMGLTDSEADAAIAERAARRLQSDGTDDKGGTNFEGTLKRKKRKKKRLSTADTSEFETTIFDATVDGSSIPTPRGEDSHEESVLTKPLPPLQMLSRNQLPARVIHQEASTPSITAQKLPGIGNQGQKGFQLMASQNGLALGLGLGFPPASSGATKSSGSTPRMALDL